MTRPTNIVVDLAALRANYRLARRVHGHHALAVIKANAYGHGALQCANALAPDADGFAVAFLDEAAALRAGGIRNPILVLEGVFDDTELDLASDLGLWLVVHQDEQIKMIARSRAPARSLHVWLKIDSGMHRAGFALENAKKAHERLMDTGKVRAITLMTHFACADDPKATMTAEQIERFDAATIDLPGDRSLCNSAGLLWWPKARRDWGRPGLMLYGISPEGCELPNLQPVMSFRSRVFATREVQAGEALGYGATYVANKPMRVGLVCAGYADGYPQTAASGTPVAVNGQRTTTVGRVSMDMLIVDLTHIPDAIVGSEVELWGPTIRVSDVAKAAGRIAYELVCNVKRAPVIYRHDLASFEDTARFDSPLAANG